jgi:hypothetical protein
MPETTPLSAQDWLAKRKAEARAAFSNHRFRDIGPGHWRLAQPGKSAYWCDIVIMGNCAISVWGDIAGCIFAYAGSNPENETIPGQSEAIVAWLGSNPDPSYYGLQKADIGMSNVGCVEFRDEVAIYDLRERLKDAEEEFGAEWDEEQAARRPFGKPRDIIPKQEYTEAITAAIEDIEHGEHLELVKRDLGENLQYVDSDCWEWLDYIGKVPSIRVIYALYAIARLHELLQTEDS